MTTLEQILVPLAFLLVGSVVGYVTFLIFRIAIHQRRSEWTGALSVITTLAGGGFLSYTSHPLNFATYGIGYFCGFVWYWKLLQSEGDRNSDRSVTGSTAVYSDGYDDDEPPEAPRRGLGSQAASVPLNSESEVDAKS
jgi:hypothetical protein